MSRVVFPNLFEVWGAPITVGSTPQQALRWMLADEMGLPTEHFLVWGWTKALPVKEVTYKLSASHGARVVSWTGGPAAAVQVSVDVAAGTTAQLRAHTGPRRTGPVADVETVVGPVTGRSVVLSASTIASVSVAGASAVATKGSALLHADLVAADGWRLLERVGLPVDKRFDGLYPLTPQGPAGTNFDPLEAARRRVKAGTPDTGWPAVTDRGAAVPAFDAPDPAVLVVQEIRPLLGTVATLLSTEPEPSRHAGTFVDVAMRGPRSIHGIDAPQRWQDTAGGKVQPLGTLRLAAGTDPFNALALGYGTTVDPRKAMAEGVRPKPPVRLPGRPPVVAPRAASLPRVQLFMVTVRHRVTFELPPLGQIELEGDFAGFHLAEASEAVDPPAGLGAERVGLDRPAAVDEPWLEVAEVSWNPPAPPAVSRAVPRSYAVLRAAEPVLEKRVAGGFQQFVHAGAVDGDPPTRVRFGDEGIREAFPGEPTGVVYSVAVQDWFGRWSGWSSVDYSRGSVAPQVPAVRAVTVTPVAGGGQPADASVRVEFVWDWANRTPEKVTVRVLVHRDGDPPPAGNGSVLAVGGPLAGDHVVDFTGATPAVPPPGAEEIIDERTADLRTYAVTLPGLRLDQVAFDRIRVSALARASERVRPGVHSAFSPVTSTVVTSPLPPAPPLVPADMIWASLPDPAGVSRVTLEWSGTAASFAVYLADETAIARELGLPSPDLGTPAADRLVPLRAVSMAGARRAFRRVADGLTSPSLAVELPRGTQLIQFFAVVGVSSTGVENALPAAANSYMAVAVPRLLVPETPVLRVRQGSRLHVDVAETVVPVERVELFRVRGRHMAGHPEAAGPPALVLAASSGTRAGGVLRWVVDDPGPLPVWEPLFYRARAWAAAVARRGEVPGRSAVTAAVETVMPAPTGPAMAGLTVAAVPGVAGILLASFAGVPPGERFHLGVHRITVTVVGPGAHVETRRADADRVETHEGPLPDLPAGAVFVHRPGGSAPPRVCTRVPAGTVAVVAEVADPLGRVARETWRAP